MAKADFPSLPVLSPPWLDTIPQEQQAVAKADFPSPPVVSPPRLDTIPQLPLPTAPSLPDPKTWKNPMDKVSSPKITGVVTVTRCVGDAIRDAIYIRSQLVSCCDAQLQSFHRHRHGVSWDVSRTGGPVSKRRLVEASIEQYMETNAFESGRPFSISQKTP